jgi:branched-subunit amino acid transport protein AzlD
MIDTTYALGVMAAMAAVTFGLRALPFLAARFLQSHPLVQRLGRFLPLAIMTLLLLHTLVGSAQQNPSGPWSELAAVVTVIALQWWKKHALLSILAGTALYVLLRNVGLAGVF